MLYYISNTIRATLLVLVKWECGVPKEVDHDERRDEILAAVTGLLADVGLRGLTIRALAARMGGSVSMVTHYFSTRHSLLVGIGPWILRKWQAEIESLDGAGSDPVTRLRSVLAWLLPLTSEAMLEERAGLSLLVGNEKDAAAVEGLRIELDAWVRSLVREHLVGLVDEARVKPTEDILYALTRGIAVCACEDPEAWSAERQLAVLDELLDFLGLLPPSSGTESRLKGVKINVCGGKGDQEEEQ
jgi:AcrR family transcriptional regulator